LGGVRFSVKAGSGLRGDERISSWKREKWNKKDGENVGRE
jgi:hypothetical protein